MPIIDRRGSNSDRNSVNRQKFIERNKQAIKDQVDDALGKRKFENLDKVKDIRIKKTSIKEPRPKYSDDTGDRDWVAPGNKEYKKGDKIDNSSSSGRGQVGHGEDEEGDFIFSLTKEEMWDIFFSDMELPDFIKESLKQNVIYVRERCGYTKEGVPARLDLKKTFEAAIARKIASKGMSEELGIEKKKSLYLDDSDLRYRYYSKKPKPSKSAVMFLVQDVSGSVTEEMRFLSKKLFILLYLFLNQTYEKIEIVYITHTDIPKEVSYEEFMYGNRTGGTIVYKAYKMVNDIIKERYDSNKYNIYIAQSSDGWVDRDDLVRSLSILTKHLLPKIQYIAYAEVVDRSWGEMWGDMYSYYKYLKKSVLWNHKKLGAVQLKEDKDIFPSLQKLFGKKTNA